MKQLLILGWWFYWLLASLAHADIGLQWLSEQGQADGRYSTSSDITRYFESTSEALRTLTLLSHSPSPLAIDLLNAESYLNTEYLSRQIIANFEAHRELSTLLTPLSNYQNGDGGFGDLLGYESTVLDTSYALQALAYVGMYEHPAAAPAIAFLRQKQRPDGGFALNPTNETSSVFVTALANLALQRLSLRYNLTTTLESARYFLANQLATETLADWEISLALLAIIPLTTDASRYQTALQTLRAHQNSRGAWNNDVYTTALALRVLSLAEQAQVPANVAQTTLNGKIVDKGTGQPLAGVQILVGNTSPTPTGEDGLFSLAVSPATYEINYTLAGYNSVVQTASLVTGQSLNVGTIRLEPLSNTSVITGIVNDALTQQPISGAHLSVNLANSETIVDTDATGHYRLVIAPNTAQVSVSAAGYTTFTATTTLTAGTTLNFSPSLQPVNYTPPNTSITLTGVVIDADTQTPLAQVPVSLKSNAQTAETDHAGLFRLAGLTSGEQSLTVSLAGYQTVNLNLLASGGSIFDLGTIRLPRLAATTVTLSGQIRDGNTNSPVQGAQIAIEPVGIISSTDAQGSYSFTNINATDFNLTVSATGYYSRTQHLQLTEPTHLGVDVTLQPTAVENFSILAWQPQEAQYTAYQKVLFEAQFKNRGTENKTVQLVIQVINPEKVIIDNYPAVHAPLANETADSSLTVLGNTQLTTQFEWNASFYPPGDYQLTLQAYDPNSLQLLAERVTNVRIQPIQAVNLLLSAEPRYSKIGATAQIRVLADLQNRSNIASELAVKWQWRDPSGNLLREQTSPIPLNANEIRKTVTLGEFPYTFTNSGEYPLAVQLLSGALGYDVRAITIRVAPAIHIKATEEVSPVVIPPENQKRLRIQLQLRGEQK